MKRLAVSLLLLSLEVNSAIAFTAVQTRGLAHPVPSLDATTQSEGEINDKNWQQHPKIIAIRRIVKSAHTQVRNGAFKTEHRICEEAGLVGFESPATQKGTADGTSIIRKAKTLPGTIISITTLVVVCSLC